MPFPSLYEQTLARMFGGLPQQDDFAQPRRPGVVQPLPRDEEASLLSQIGGSALEGVGWLGGSLDKALGGRAIRGLVGGRPEEALSLIPFSDTLGITDPGNQVTGAELLGDRNADFLSPEGLGGLALEIGLDPSTYLTLGAGAVGKLGQSAKGLGILPKTMAGRIAGFAHGSPELASLAKATGLQASEIAAKPLGGIAGLGLPFSTPDVLLGTGATGQRVAEALGQGAEALKYSLPGRHLSALFDPAVSGLTSETGQRAARTADEAARAGMVGARGSQLDVLRSLQEADQLGQGDALRSLMEFKGQGPLRPEWEALAPAAGKMRTALDDMLAQEQALGLPIKGLVDDGAEYFPRYQTPLDKPTKGFGKREAMPTGHPSMLGREDILRDVPGGTATINEMAKDVGLKGMVGDKLTPSIAGTAPNPLGPASSIREKYLGMTAADQTQMHTLAQQAQAGAADKAALSSSVKQLGDPNLSAADRAALSKKIEQLAQQAQQTGLGATDQAALTKLQSTYDQSVRLADWLRSVDPQMSLKQLNFFGNDPTTDFLARSIHHERAIAGTNAVHDMLAASAKVAGQAEPGSVSLRQVLWDAGLGEAGQPTQGAMQQQLQRLAGRGINAQTAGDLSGLFVPAQVARDASRFAKATASPEGIAPFLKMFDQVSNLTKTGQTSLWPAFHARNGVTGMFMNWITDAGDPRFAAMNPARYLQPLKDAADLRVGKTVAGANTIKGFEHLTDEAATRALADEIFKHELNPGGGVFKDVLGEGAHVAQKGVPKLPGSVQPGIGESALELMKSVNPRGKTWEQLNPLNVRGVAADVDMFAPAKAGRELGEAVDDVNRISAYIGKRRQGYIPSMAAAESKAAHYDYSRLTDFERSVMRRVIPFYNWLSNNIPMAVEQLMTKPGGKYATSIKAAARTRGGEPGFLPSYLGSGMAMPIGDEEDGTKRFLSQTGLPFEDFAENISSRGALSVLNPLIKAPLELATGKQFFTGRDLADLHSLTGATVGDQLLFNSPLGRAASTARMFLDPRKDIAAKLLNFGTGLRLTDVDMEKSKDIAARDFITDELRGSMNVGEASRLFARPDQVQNLTPQELLMLRLQATRDRARRVGVRR